MIEAEEQQRAAAQKKARENALKFAEKTRARRERIESGLDPETPMERLRSGQMRFWQPSRDQQRRNYVPRAERAGRRSEKRGLMAWIESVRSGGDDDDDDAATDDLAADLPGEWSVSTTDRMRYAGNRIGRSLLPGGLGCFCYSSVYFLVCIAILVLGTIVSVIMAVAWANRDTLLSIHP